MTGWRAWVAAIAALALALPTPIDAAPKRRAPRATKGAAPAPLPEVMLPPAYDGVPAARKTTDLASLIAKRAKYDYNVTQQKMLERYDTPPDKRHAYAIDHNFEVIDAPRVERYLQRIADRLMGCWTGPKPPIRIMVTGSSVPSAFANDGGLIRISAGLLDELKTTHELAFVLAHELAHVLYEHQAKREALQRAIKTGIGVLSSATILARETQFRKVGGKFDIAMRSEFGSTGYLLSGYATQSFSDEAIIPFRRADQEFEADRLAYDLAMCARFDPSAVDQAVLVLGAAERPNLDALKFVAAIGAQYISKVLVKTKKDDVLSMLLQAGTQLAIGAAMDKVIDAIAGEIEKSMGGTKRSKKLMEYRDKAYDVPPDAIPPTDTALLQLKSDPYWQSLWAVVSEVSRIDARIKAMQKQVGPGQPIEDPKPEFWSAWSSLPQVDRRVPQTYNLVAMRRYAEGNAVQARQVWDDGSRLHWGYREMLDRSGGAHFAAADVGALQRTIGLARQRLGNVPEILPLDARLAWLNKDIVGAEKIAAKCLTDGGDDLYYKCVRPMDYDPVCAPKTEEGKVALQAAVLSRQSKTFLNLPGIAATINAPPPVVLKCLANTTIKTS